MAVLVFALVLLAQIYSAQAVLSVNGNFLTLKKGYKWSNQYDRDLNFECPDGSWMNSVNSKHHAWYEDRMFYLTCATAKKGTKLPPTKECYWSNWANSYDRTLNFKCKDHHFIAGIKSRHNSWYEDRITKFKCCTNGKYYGINCKHTNWVNGWDGNMVWSLDSGKQYMNGWYSVHSNWYEDRRHKFYVCDMSLTASPPTTVAPISRNRMARGNRMG